MTAINEDGQVYWTFEELDLEGAFEEVWEEQQRISVIRDWLMEKIDFKNMDCPFAKEFFLLGERYKILISVREALRGLIKYE